MPGGTEEKEFKSIAEEIMGKIRRSLEDPAGYMRRRKSERRQKVVGWLLTDIPEELIHAAGALPFGITGGREEHSRSDAHLQNWACSMARSCLDMGLQGKLSFLDGLLIPHICDTTRNLGGIWRHARPLAMMENYLLPRQTRPSAKTYLVGELGRLKARLERCTGSEITAGKLSESISLYNWNRRLLRKLFGLHGEKPGLLSNRAIYDIIKSSLFIPKEEHNELLQELIDHLTGETAGDGRNTGHVRLALSGKVCDPPEIMDALDACGAVVVADDLATGQRYISAEAPETGDPIEALAQRQLSRIPCACFDTGETDRRRFLTDLIKASGAAGLIFLHLKYCEPENFDYPDMRAAVEAAGIPCLRLETDIGGVSQGQLETRLQAFVEMIKGGTDVDRPAAL